MLLHWCLNTVPVWNKDPVLTNYPNLQTESHLKVDNQLCNTTLEYHKLEDPQLMKPTYSV